ncbi:uncharacterized protein [Macrobrachium rosenbergii]|uniref:uncharacterized protein n=1 Tax=Macrobrachium rosenbergii TaxID=79674 RepID=UPI0034D7021E
MSKKIEDSELQTLTLSPTNTNDDESSLFINPASDETTFPISPPPAFPPAPPPAPPIGEKRKLERISSVPVSGVKTVPTLRVSTPPGSARISYANEKTSGKMDFSKITRDRPTPGSTIGQKKDAPRQSEKSRPGSLVLSIGGKGLPSTKSSLKKTDSGGGSKPSSGSHTAKGMARKLSEIDTSLKPLARGSSSNPVGKGGLLSGQGVAMSSFSSRLSTGPKGWLGRAGIRSGPRIREGIDSRQMDRPTQHHTFLTDVADVRQIEQGLLQLMEDFQAGNLRAFGKDSRLRQMEAIREQQERLARLHFDVGAEQDLHPPLSEEGLKTSHENMRTLMEKLAQLSESIERLHTNTSSDRKTSSNERKSTNHQASSNQPSGQRISDHANHSNLNTGANENIPGRSGDPLNVTSPLATSSPQNANIGNSISNNANNHSSPVGSNTAQGQQNANNANRNRNSGGYQSAIKNGKNAES